MPHRTSRRTRAGWALAMLLLVQAGLLSAQEPSFTYDSVGLTSDFSTVARRFPHSVPQDQYVSLVPEDIHDHISAVEVSGQGAIRRVRIAFETRPDGEHPDYPACAVIERQLVARYGKAHEIHQFMEEASPRADRIWRSRTEVLTLICFQDAPGELLAEAVQITPR